MIADRPPGHGERPRRPGGPVLAIGARALVSPGPGASVLALCDENGVATGATLAADAEVEVIAWLPRGAAGARYRIRHHPDGAEGWVEAARIRPRPVPAAPPRVTKLPPAPPRAGGVSARPRRSSR